MCTVVSNVVTTKKLFSDEDSNLIPTQQQNTVLNFDLDYKTNFRGIISISLSHSHTHSLFLITGKGSMNESSSIILFPIDLLRHTFQWCTGCHVFPVGIASDKWSNLILKVKIVHLKNRMTN
ncbi:TATA-binding protein-associated factor [Dirofilaria immitis]